MSVPDLLFEALRAMSKKALLWIVVGSFVVICTVFFLELGGYLVPYSVFDPVRAFPFGNQWFTGAFICWFVVLGIYVAKVINTKSEQSAMAIKTYKVNAPLMLASSPLFLDHENDVFRRYNINIKLSFRYSGIQSLDDLKKNKSDFSVASDIAIASFLNTDPDTELSILPFVKITNHLRIVAKPDIKELPDLDNKKISYLANSVHEHYLQTLESKAELTPRANIMDCYYALITGDTNACVFWEPHYAIINKYDMTFVKMPKETVYNWFLCLVTKKKYLDENPGLAGNMQKAMEKATSHCRQNYDTLALNNVFYTLSEFTGATNDDLNSLLSGKLKDEYTFAVSPEMTRDFDKRIDSLEQCDKYPKAMYRLQHGHWPGLKNQL